ncbi:MAG: GNAT family N-acetyltransferase [Gemmatimonadaceae bacterium]
MNLRPVTADDRTILDRLMQFYMYDFSEIVELDFDQTGVFPSGLLSRFLPDSNNRAWFIESEGSLAGFVLVSINAQLKNGKFGSLVKEFFVMRAYRGKNLGRRAAHEVFKLHPGEWNVSVMQKNMRALEFWNDTIRTFTNGQFVRRVYDDDWKGTTFSFSSQTTSS